MRRSRGSAAPASSLLTRSARLRPPRSAPPLRSVVVSQLALPKAGRCLYAGLASGRVRCAALPLSEGGWADVPLHAPASGLSRLVLSPDDGLLFSAGTDGCIYVSEAQDADGELLGGRKEREGLPWAEEVLVGRAELEEKGALLSELRSRAEEVSTQADYQLRLKELAFADQLRAQQERMGAEQAADRRNYALLLQAKNDLELQ